MALELWKEEGGLKSWHPEEENLMKEIGKSIKWLLCLKQGGLRRTGTIQISTVIATLSDKPLQGFLPGGICKGLKAGLMNGGGGMPGGKEG